jgi:hypothetical protein
VKLQAWHITGCWCWSSECGLVGRYRRFGGKYRLNFLGLCSSETLLSIYNPKVQHQHHHRGENFKSYVSDLRMLWLLCFVLYSDGWDVLKSIHAIHKYLKTIRTSLRFVFHIQYQTVRTRLCMAFPVDNSGGKFAVLILCNQNPAFCNFTHYLATQFSHSESTYPSVFCNSYSSHLLG